MDLDQLLTRYGEQNVLAWAGVVAGAVFGVLAQHSRFCMRSAVIDCVQGDLHPGQHGYGKLAVWLLAFATAVLGTQSLALLGMFDADSVRQLSSAGSLSGAIVGGLLLGVGMILARGCPSRMLVLSANGNLRALVTGLFFVVTAQASMTGALKQLREWISAGWPIDAASRNLLGLLGVGHGGGLVIGLAWLIAAVYFARYSQLPRRIWLGGIGVGATVAAAWWLTYQISVRSFDIVVSVQAISFTNPSAEVLMWLLAHSDAGVNFGIGLVPGVVLGSFAASQWAGEFRLEGFRSEHNILRYLAGAAAMGMGGVLAGGCAVGAGVSGASVFGVTAWVALFCMWLGAAAAHVLLDRVLDHIPVHS